MTFVFNCIYTKGAELCVCVCVCVCESACVRRFVHVYTICGTSLYRPKERPCCGTFCHYHKSDALPARFVTTWWKKVPKGPLAARFVTPSLATLICLSLPLLCVCVCVCVCVYCVFVCVYMFVCLCACVCMCLCMCVRACDVLCMCIQFMAPPCTDQERGPVAARFVTTANLMHCLHVLSLHGDKTCRKVHSLHILSLLPQQH